MPAIRLLNAFVLLTITKAFDNVKLFLNSPNKLILWVASLGRAKILPKCSWPRWGQQTVLRETRLDRTHNRAEAKDGNQAKLKNSLPSFQGLR